MAIIWAFSRKVPPDCIPLYSRRAGERSQIGRPIRAESRQRAFRRKARDMASKTKAHAAPAPDRMRLYCLAISDGLFGAAHPPACTQARRSFEISPGTRPNAREGRSEEARNSGAPLLVVPRRQEAHSPSSEVPASGACQLTDCM